MQKQKEQSKEENYQAPKLVKIGSLEAVTLGSKNDDTADENSYRY